MTKLLISLTKKKSNDLRSNLSIMSGVVGIICNVLLCLIKFAIGTISGSLSITADEFNNLSDAASNIVTIVGTKIAKKPIDKDHPFGHGRVEYISALVVAFMIFLMGFELAKTSVDKILHPVELKFSLVYVIIILIAILVKFWMAYFNTKLYKMTDNINLKAVAQDSLNDCISTFAAVVSLIICHFFNIIWVDGVVGLFVSLFILYSGVGIVKEIMNPLLGQPPEEELVNGIKDIMLSEELIIGVHDLIVHDYGPSRIIASAHAEVPSNVDVMKLHDIIDVVEQRIRDELNIIICIHMDPIVVDDEEVQYYKDLTQRLLNSYNSEYSFHDFRVVKGETHTNLIFDVVVPIDKNYNKNEIIDGITNAFKQENEKLCLVLTIEHSYTY